MNNEEPHVLRGLTWEEWRRQVDKDRCTSAVAADATTLRKKRMARAVGIYREAATIKLQEEAAIKLQKERDGSVA